MLLGLVLGLIHLVEEVNEADSVNLDEYQGEALCEGSGKQRSESREGSRSVCSYTVCYLRCNML